ncbi:MAG: hypothetical protein K0S32_1875 [Bacteroidetes bacterium]|jgi:hypothetical protein|nr:hypothetical protein [Bacteroidota bacterium]
MFKKFYLVLFALSVSCVLTAQDQKNIFAGTEEGSTLNILYRNDATGKIYANTRGLGVSYKRGKHVTGKTRSFYEVDIQSLKHPKEIKVSGTAESRKRFVYGKLNSVFLLRGAVGMQNEIYQKADNKAVAVRVQYSLGPTLGLAKPYYVQVYRSPSVNNGQSRTEDVRFNEDNFTQDSVIGKGVFSKGIAETVVYPAVTGKLNLSFEYAPFSNIIRAIETGITVDYFPKALPIMARNPAENIIITLHVGFVFGRKWI